MKLVNVLSNYETSLLDQLSLDKIDEAINLRLPQPVIVQEIVSALCSQSYISDKVLYSRPPAFAILHLILQAPGYMMSVDSFRAKVLEYVKELSLRAAENSSQNERNAKLYIKILRRAWESDGMIDKSESYILEFVRFELNIWDREHFTLMHDTSILELWDIEKEYYSVRNQLLSTGILLTYEDKYIIAEEVALQIRKAFGIDLMNDSYSRLLSCFGNDELSYVLSSFELNKSGTKEILINRLLNSLIPPADVLNVFHLDRLREVCRKENIQISGTKHTVIENIINFFDENLDLRKSETEAKEIVSPEPELREMDSDVYARILSNLTGQQLYDILFHNSIMTSGTKDEKVKRILNSYKSERSVFNDLRKEDLSQLCRKFNLNVSGSKQELIDRLIDYEPSIIIKDDFSTIVETNELETNSKILAPKKEDVADQAPSNLPLNWDEVNKEFKDFEFDEKIVIALLKEAKSLTEQDLSRIVARHNLHWVLHKAHMVELIAKLQRANKAFIQIKSIQNANIYQWESKELNDNQVFEKKSARDIIDALRHGVVPKSNLDLLMVGQQTARDHLSEILMEINPNKSHFKFIRGQYGSGKTFLCSWLKELALNNEFAVSFINVSHEQPLSDLPIFFSGLLNGLRTPEKKNSGALVDILESWLLNVHNRTIKVEGLADKSSMSNKELFESVEKNIEIELAKFNDIDPGISQALRAFYDGKVTGNMELVTNSVAWITGSKSLSTQALREIGVKGYLESNQVFSRMRVILELISGAKYKGLLLLIDELELVRKFPHARQREQSYETLRLLIDEVGRNAFPGCLILFTGTDEFFEDDRYGLMSYEALAERVVTHVNHENFVSMRQPIITLESLDSQRLANVIYKVRDLYGIAYGWDAKTFADDSAIMDFIAQWTIFGEESIDRKPRPILREFIQMLDLCEENKGVYLREFIKATNLTALTESTLS